jgi:hypothetical protein
MRTRIQTYLSSFLLAAPEVRDLWLHRDFGRQERYTAEQAAHGAVLLRVK